MKTMNKLVVLALAIAINGCAGKAVAPNNTAPKAEVTRSFYLMGTYLDVVVQAQNRELALTASDAVFQTVRDDERRLSTWMPHSELSTVNQTPVGKEAKLSPLLERDLKNAYFWAQETGFTFTPWIGPMVKAWHLRSGGKIPSLTERNSAMKASQPDAFRLTQHGVIKQLSGANIEEGGFGKGIALDDAAHSLASEGVTSAVLNFGLWRYRSAGRDRRSRQENCSAASIRKRCRFDFNFRKCRTRNDGETGKDHSQDWASPGPSLGNARAV
jgi:thiamine biosynthesis lipoprotein ApbE